MLGEHGVEGLRLLAVQANGAAELHPNLDF
jgi:hypothetical protein